MLKKILAIGISVALLLTSVICVRAEVNLVSSATISNADVVFEPSTVTTGSIGWKNNAASLDDIASPDAGYGLQEGTSFVKLTRVNENSGWLPMYHYNADKQVDSLILNSKDYYGGNNKYIDIKSNAKLTGSFYPAYKVDTTGYNVKSISVFSGSVYSATTTGTTDIGIVVNYIDNGNFDYIRPAIVSGSLYLRNYAVRTETVVEGGISYKKVYHPSNYVSQINLGSFSPATATIDETSLAKFDFSIEYFEEGIKITCSNGTDSLSTTLENNYFSDAARDMVNIIDSTDKKQLSAFSKNTTLSNAKSVGFAVFGNASVYAGDVNLKFDYNKSISQLADDFRNTHVDILGKSEVTADDQEAIELALNNYDELLDILPEIAVELATEKALLDGFAASLLGDDAQAYLTEHSVALALTVDTVSKENVSLILAAKTAYDSLADEVKEKALDLFNEANETNVTDLAEYLLSIANEVYYEDDLLVYDDFSGVNSSIWTTNGNVTYINQTRENRITSLTYNFDVTIPEITTGTHIYYPFLTYAYDGTNVANSRLYYTSGALYIRDEARAGYDSEGYKQGNMKLYECVAGNELKVAVTYNYDYAPYDAAEASKLHNNCDFAAHYIHVPITVVIKNTAGEELFTTTLSLVSLYPTEQDEVTATAQGKKALSDIYYVGYNSGGKDTNISMQSIEISYAKPQSEFSAEFEAFASTYGLTPDDVTNVDAANIDEAIAVYQNLTEAQKSAYASEYANLVALKPVADFHSEILAYNVTPASEEAISNFNAEFNSLNVDNDYVLATINALWSAFDAFRPQMHSATIKKTSNVDEQDLRFRADVNTTEFTAKVVSYGMVMVPNLALGNEELLIGETYIYNNNPYDAVSAQISLKEGDTVPAYYYAQLGNSCVSNNRCGTRIAARAFVTYEIDGVSYTLYSTNTNDIAESNPDTPTVGVRNGVAVRSIYSIARVMTTDVLNSGEDFVETDAITSATTPNEIGAIEGQEIIKFTAANVDLIVRLNS